MAIEVSVSPDMDERVNPDITLENLNLYHTQELYDLTVLNQEYLREWLDRIESSSDTKLFIENSIKEIDAGGALKFVILYEGEICGVIGFHEINKQKRIGIIGYWLGQSLIGSGIITLAVRELLIIGFRKLNLIKIEIRCAKVNSRSRAITERLGFTHEETLRDCSGFTQNL